MFESVLETITVIVIVASVLVLGGRLFYLTLTGKKKGQCCGCDSCTCENVKKRN